MSILDNLPDNWEHWVHNNAAGFNEYMYVKYEDKDNENKLIWIEVSCTGVFLREIKSYCQITEDVIEVLKAGYSLYKDLKEQADNDPFNKD